MPGSIVDHATSCLHCKVNFAGEAIPTYKPETEAFRASAGINVSRIQVMEKGLRFKLWRQDDNGNHFLIGVFTDRAAAGKRLSELTQNPHKQIYWIAEEPAGQKEEE